MTLLLDDVLAGLPPRLADLAVSLGAPLPRLLTVPPGIVSISAGEETVELAALAGLHLDPWEAWSVIVSLGERADGTYAAYEVVDIVARQNGKGSKLEARELGLLFLLGEKLGMHSAHEFDTALEAFGRLMTLIEDTPDLDRKVHKAPTGNGKEAIITKSGSRLRFRARTKKGARGFAGVDVLFLDEAFELPAAALGSVIPTQSSKPNAQVWVTSSAVDQLVHPNGHELTRLRNRAISGDADRMFLCEYSPCEREDFEAGLFDPADPAVIAAGNPGLGYRLTLESAAREREFLSPRMYSVERLNIGDWPALEELDSVINRANWTLRKVEHSLESARAPLSSAAVAVECSPDRSHTAIITAGRRADGRAQLELVAYEPGVEWAYEWLQKRNGRQFCARVIDPGGPAGFMIERLARMGVKVEEPTAREFAQASVGLVTAVDEDGLVWVDETPLDLAAKVVGKRKIGESWGFQRFNAKADVAPIVGGALALHGLNHPQKIRSGNVW